MRDSPAPQAPDTGVEDFASFLQNIRLLMERLRQWAASEEGQRFFLMLKDFQRQPMIALPARTAEAVVVPMKKKIGFRLDDEE